MSYESLFFDAFKSAMRTVLRGFDMNFSEDSLPVKAGGEVLGAALKFHGDMSGYAVITVPEACVNAMAKIVLKGFGVDFEIENTVLFAEMLNIVVGNIATTLSKLDVKVRLDSPAPIDVDFDLDQVAPCYIVALVGGESFKFSMPKA